MKIKLFTCLVLLFTVLIAAGETRDFGTYDLYYNSDLDWVIYDNQNNQHPASMIFGFRPSLNLHWSFEDLLQRL